MSKMFIPRNKQEQDQYVNLVSSKLEKVTMSWSNVLKDWYPIAIKALDFASTLELRVPQSKYAELFKEETHGINMNVVMALCNNIENRTPVEMGLTAKKWIEVLQLNSSVADSWKELALPIQKEAGREMEIMRGSKLSIAE